MMNFFLSNLLSILFLYCSAKLLLTLNFFFFLKNDFKHVFRWYFMTYDFYTTVRLDTYNGKCAQQLFKILNKNLSSR